MFIFWLLQQNISSYDKIRIIALYVMTKNGMSEENLNKLFTHAQINIRDQDMVRNLCYVGVNVLLTDVSLPHWNTYNNNNQQHSFDFNNYIVINAFSRMKWKQGNRKKPYQVPRKNRVTEQTYQMSRWTPVLKDILEDCIEDKLDSRHFPFLAGRAQSATYHAPTRYLKSIPYFKELLLNSIHFTFLQCSLWSLA